MYGVMPDDYFADKKTMAGTARIDLRLEPEELALIKAAAAAEHRSVTSYLVRLGVTYARTVLDDDNQPPAAAATPPTRTPAESVPRRTYPARVESVPEEPEPEPEPEEDEIYDGPVKVDYSLPEDDFIDELLRLGLDGDEFHSRLDHWRSVNG